MTKQQKQNVKKWISALRSGKYKQGIGQLRKGDKFCCLGVACEVLGINAEKTNVGVKGNETFIYGSNRSTVLPQKAKKMLGLKSVTGSFEYGSRNLNLTSENDSGKTFNKIADIIESKPDGLFVD